MFREWLILNKNWVLQNFPFLEDDFDALTDYELFCKFIGYVKKIAITNDRFLRELKNDLEEMYQEGKFDSLIESIVNLQLTFTYPTVASMKQATNLVDGSYAKTLGFYQINDKGDAYYRIRNITNEDTVDNIHLFALADESLVAELLVLSNNINIKKLGASTSIDNKSIIQYALDNYSEIILDEMYEVYDTISINEDNITIKGNGGIFINHDKNKDLISMEDVSNITFENISLTNDDIRTGNTSPADKYLIKILNCNNLNFNNIKVYNAYNGGIKIKKSNTLNFINCEFKNCYYDMLTLLSETQNILVDNCIFDTCTTTYENSYLIANGSDNYDEEVEFLSKNITIQNSKFLNNPNWEGIDSHGCENWKIINNYIYNCKEGIHYAYDKRPNVTNILNNNIIIKNNIIENPTLSPSVKSGIVVIGADIKFSKNITIDSNIIINYGAINSTYPIQIEYSKDFTITNNKIDSFSIGGIQTAWVINGSIKNNIIKNPKLNTAVGIRLNAYTWLVRVNDNEIISGNILVDYGILINNYKGLALLGNNFINGYRNGRILSQTNNNTIIGEVANTNTRRLGCKGVYSIDENDVPKSYCTDQYIRSISETVTDITITASVDDTLITLSNNEDVTSKLCEGQEIVIPGAGTAGADLTTVISDIIGINKFIIKDAILTDVSAVHPSTTASTWSNF